jgi:hypothetical protein
MAIAAVRAQLPAAQVDHAPPRRFVLAVLLFASTLVVSSPR